MQSGKSFAASFSRQTGSLLIGLVTCYKRLISPLLPSACRFHPTCSDYMREAIAVHGPLYGVWLGMKRLGRCQPFHAGGFDYVPPRELSQHSPPQQT
ncbi:MAG TPA: membrane protein insertion efficiency factor YidD [Bryobacteraceae bacterium]|nr:membrane protein insertion efficiency factor YidD [Bryobacteraceae bacterium]